MLVLKNILKCTFLFALVAFAVTNAQSQDERKSPAKETTATVGDVDIMITYGAPSVKGRTIFGDLIAWGDVWRTGANEASTFEVSKNVTVEGEELPAGKYALFTIPGEDKWTIIFNSVADQWGAYDYDQSKDVLRVEVMPKNLDESVEQMKIGVKEDGGSGHVYLKWANTKVAFAVAPVASN